MAHQHTRFTDGCFACKMRTVSFGTVPGAYKDTNSTSMYDGDSLAQMDWPSREEVEDNRADMRNTPITEEVMFVPDPE